MTDKTIGDLTTASTPLDGTELVEIEQSGNSRKATVADLSPKSGWVAIGSPVSASGSSVSFTSIPQTYSELMFVVEGLSHGSGSSQPLNIEISNDNGTTWEAFAQEVTAYVDSTSAWYGVFIYWNYTGDTGGAQSFVGAPASPLGTAVLSYQEPHFATRHVGGLNAVRFSLGDGSFDAGEISLYAKGLI